MDSIKLKNKGNTLMIAHRGGNVFERENSLPAFETAGKHSYFGMETDIHVTSDNGYIVCHDDNTGRVASTDICIEKSTFDECKKVKIVGLDGKTHDGMVLPSYEEYLEVCKETKKVGVVELKNTFPRKNIMDVIEITRAHGMLDNVIFISFMPENMFILRELLPTQKLQWLCVEIKDGYIDIMKYFHIDFDVRHTAVTSKEVVDKIHDAGLKINVWTVDDEETANRLISYGVDFITSNCLE